MVDIGLLHHRAHGVLDGAVRELVIGVLLPDGFEVEVGPVHDGFEELQGAGVRQGFDSVFELGLERDGESVGL